MTEEKVTYSELKLSDSKKRRSKQNTAHRKRGNQYTVILGIICLLLLLVIVILGYIGFQKPAIQDLKNLKENNTFSPETEDNFTSSSGTGDFYFQAPRCGSCQEKWFCCGRNCYYFSEERLTWEESVKSCHSKGSSLVKIDDNRELNFIQSQMKYAYWVGLNRKGTMHEWMWRDGTALAKNLAFQATNAADKCGFLKSRLIKSAPCANQLSYICEKDVPSLEN